MEWATRADAARNTGVPYTTIVEWADQGKIQAIKKGRDVWVDEDEVRRVAAEEWTPRKKKTQ